MQAILKDLLAVASLIGLNFHFSPVALAQSTSTTQSCLAISDNDTRLDCIKALVNPTEPRAIPFADYWPLIRSTDDASGRTIVSISKAVDPSKSTLDLAGLMIRCSSSDLFEVLVVLVAPLPLRTKSLVSLETQHGTISVEGEIVAPGFLLLLPREAFDAIRSDNELSPLKVAVKTVSQEITGVIALEGLSVALIKLTNNCNSR